MITIEHLRREYGSVVALENLSLDVPRGVVYGLIGPNGAGKTTLLRILATLLEPTYGRVTVDGVDILAEPKRVHGRIGFMVDMFKPYEKMRCREYLDYFARAYRVNRWMRAGRLASVIELTGLGPICEKDIRTLSRGMRQRLCLAKTLIHEPDVLLLDEPAGGLDPAGRAEFRGVIKQLHAMGRTILVSSHILSEMADFCTHIGVLETGRLLANGPVHEVIATVQPHLRLAVETLGAIDALEDLLAADERVANVTRRNHGVAFDFTGQRADLPGLHRRLVEAGVPVVSFALVGGDLEDVYMKISGHHTG